MKTKQFKISQKAHELLVVKAAYKSIELGRRVSLTEALDFELGIEEAQK